MDDEAPFHSLPSGVGIAHYFVEETDRQNNGCRGIDLYRDGADYCYLWVDTVVDHDYLMAYLLDIRTNTRGAESRDYLFVAHGPDMFEVQWRNKPIDFSASFEEHRARHLDGLWWFTDRVDDAFWSGDKP